MSECRESQSALLKAYFTDEIVLHLFGECVLGSACDESRACYLFDICGKLEITSIGEVEIASNYDAVAEVNFG